MNIKKIPRKAMTCMFAAFLITACAKTILVWQTPLPDNPSFTILYPGGAGISFYRIAYFDDTGAAEVSHYDIAGNVLSNQTFSDIDLTPETKAYPVGDSGAFLLDDSSANTVRSVAYMDPESRVVWQGLPAALDVFYSQSAFVAGDLIIVSGTFQDNDGSYKHMIATVGADQSVNRITYENLVSLDVFHVQGSESVVVIGKHPDDPEAGVGEQSFLQRLDYSLSEQYFLELDYEFSADMVSDTTLRGSMVIDDQSIYGLYDYEGNHIGDAQPDNPWDRIDYLWARDVLYRIEEKRITVGTPTNYLYADGYEICQFNNEFKLKWCEFTEVGLLLQPYVAQIVNDNDIGITYQTRTLAPESADLSVKQIEESVLAGFDIWALASWRVHHVLYSRQGTKMLDAEPEPYSYTGRLRYCIFIGFCLIDKEHSPGHAWYRSAVFLPGHRVVSETNFQEEYTEYDGFIERGVNYLSYWETDR